MWFMRCWTKVDPKRTSKVMWFIPLSTKYVVYSTFEKQPTRMGDPVWDTSFFCWWGGVQGSVRSENQLGFIEKASQSSFYSSTLFQDWKLQNQKIEKTVICNFSQKQMHVPDSKAVAGPAGRARARGTGDEVRGIWTFRCRNGVSCAQACLP